VNYTVVHKKFQLFTIILTKFFVCTSFYAPVFSTVAVGMMLSSVCPSVCDAVYHGPQGLRAVPSCSSTPHVKLNFNLSTFPNATV